MIIYPGEKRNLGSGEGCLGILKRCLSEKGKSRRRGQVQEQKFRIPEYTHFKGKKGHHTQN